ncbi:hypothetical protein COW94_01365 [Candidatus Peregrinibacteria bacterium CG22_combo_CG10-13_8_21_14_all_44_10]|nr:MAG: hypothetical protein AUK45_01580 [Candidatus Peregrinibacteria bacterium CG2_30_44_17]PIP66514.1 MAG: hypothetical protein COW94_01365 [Candidatus Peregrinibacteria bacterium CG22_combo_CG10-13_8_21_14_all_44_10]PIS03848.1 MAG: hypothetical protein COT83_03815 [Candidatus Peregrinibacteria bacterium CG10_big_fil_rev_8_21_14_0_10_44_7]PIX80070.1 MAG: hypothetical protein COZ35_01890 [Candidatus Peregrinibacteria bacterium CG_4_10_14_3_um_filter_44_21]
MDDIKIPDDDMDDIGEGDDDSSEVIFDDDLPDLDAEIERDVSSEGEPASKVKITFGRFVKLVANHSFLDIVEKNSDQEIIISTNLLTDLANAHDGQTERKLPIVFILGIVIGVAVTYFLLSK